MNIIRSFDKKQREEVISAIYKKTVNVTKIYGSISSSMIHLLKLRTIDYYFSYFGRCLVPGSRYYFKWSFNVNELLSLNLTFIQIHFSYTFCRSHLEVYRFNKYNSDEKFKYCGQHSNVCVLPSYANVIVDMVVRATEFTTYKVAGAFSVIDRGFFTSVQNDNFIDSQMQPEAIFLFKTNGTLVYFFIKVRKGEHIILKNFLFYAQKINIYDGPGTLCLLLPHTGKVFKCSTHQCTLRVLQLSKNYTMSLNFTSLVIKSKLVYIDTSGDITLPNFNCKSTICVIDIRFNDGYQVNITLASLKFQGPKSGICKYGGLTAVESLKNEYKEHDPLCTNLYIFTLSQRRFYSVNSSLKMVLYWYQPYSTIDVKFSFSSTNCDILHISPTQFCKECDFNTPCASYFNRVTQYSNVSLKTNELDTIVYSTLDDQCFVLQLMENSTSLRYFWYCKIDIVPDFILEDHSKIHFQITGVIQPLFSEKPTNRTIASRGRTIAHYYYFTSGVRDYMALYGMIDRFCHIYSFHPKYTKSCVNNSDSSSSLHPFYKARTEVYFMNPIVAFGSFKTPTGTNSLKIAVWLLMLVNSWFEFKFHRYRHTDNNNREIQYHPHRFLYPERYLDLNRTSVSGRRETVLLLSVETNGTKRSWMSQIQAKIRLDSSDEIHMRWQSTVTFTNWKKSN